MTADWPPGGSPSPASREGAWNGAQPAGPDAETGAYIDAQVAMAFNRKMADRLADQQIAAASFRSPTIGDFPGTLADSLARPRPAQRYLVAGLLGAAHNLSIEALYKTGKTRLVAALAGSLADARPFLRFAAVTPPDGPVAVWNAEMDADDFDDYLAAEVTDASRVVVGHLRGRPMSVMVSQPARQATVAWLRWYGASVWIIDTWSRLCAWNGVDPLDAAGVARLTAALDEIKAEAGVSALVVTTHMPHAARTDPDFERAIGAQGFSGWVDCMWRYHRAASGERYLSADGRKIALEECQVVLGPDERLAAVAGDRRQAGRQQAEFAVMSYVRTNPGASRNQVENGVTGRRETIRQILADLVAQGSLTVQNGPQGSFKYLAPDLAQNLAPTSPHFAR